MTKIFIQKINKLFICWYEKFTDLVAVGSLARIEIDFEATVLAFCIEIKQFDFSVACSASKADVFLCEFDDQLMFRTKSEDLCELWPQGAFHRELFGRKGFEQRDPFLESKQVAHDRFCHRDTKCFL